MNFVKIIFSFRPFLYFRGRYSQFGGGRSVFSTESTKKDDDDDSIKEQQEVGDDGDQQNKKTTLDVAEYYTQYIKEYEQGGFKDDAAEAGGETKKWEIRHETLPIPTTRGETGVFDVDEAVEFLRAERVRNVCTVRMPKSLAYAPYMVLGNALSRRHMNAMTEKLVKAYKRKRAAHDPATLFMKDDRNPEWRAYDFGNFVVHLMTPEARRRYDIEMLWAAGPDYDQLTHTQGQLDEYSDRLRKLQEDIENLGGPSTAATNNNNNEEVEEQQQQEQAQDVGWRKSDGKTTGLG